MTSYETDESDKGKALHRMPHNGSRISGEPLLKSFDEGTTVGVRLHEPPASKAQRPQA